MENNSHDIFISYSKKDSAIVHKYVDLLRSYGYKVWMDTSSLPSGHEFAEKIVEAIENTKVFLFFSSKNSNDSQWTQGEVIAAINSHKVIVPIKIDNSPFGRKIMLMMLPLNHIDTTVLSPDEAEKKIISAMEELLGGHLPEGKGEPTGRGTTVIRKRERSGNYIIKAGVIIQTIVIILALSVCIWLFFIGLVSFNIGIRIKDILLIATLLIMLWETYRIRKRRIARWSFLLLDLAALILIVSIGFNVYTISTSQGYVFKTIIYQTLYTIGKCWVHNRQLVINYFLPVYILHNVVIIVTLNSTKLLRKLRRYLVVR